MERRTFGSNVWTDQFELYVFPSRLIANRKFGGFSFQVSICTLKDFYIQIKQTTQKNSSECDILSRLQFSKNNLSLSINCDATAIPCDTVGQQGCDRNSRLHRTVFVLTNIALTFRLFVDTQISRDAIKWHTIGIGLVAQRYRIFCTLHISRKRVFITIIIDYTSTIYWLPFEDLSE